jgi:hypothetical protein
VWLALLWWFVAASVADFLAGRQPAVLLLVDDGTHLLSDMTCLYQAFVIRISGWPG